MGGPSSGKTLFRNRSLSSLSWAKSKIKYPCGLNMAFLNESYRLWLCSGYNWRARKVNWFLSLKFFNKTRYFAFREMSLQCVPWWKMFCVCSKTLVFQWWLRLVNKPHSEAPYTWFNRSSRTMRDGSPLALPYVSGSPSWYVIFGPSFLSCCLGTAVSSLQHHIIPSTKRVSVHRALRFCSSLITKLVFPLPVGPQRYT